MALPPDLTGIITLHQQGRLAEARLGYERFLAIQPQHADARHYLGMLEHQAGNPELGLELIQASVALDPSKAFYYVNLGNVLKDLGRPRESEEAYQRAIGLEPSDPLAWYNLGHLYHSHGQWQAACDAFRRTASLRPSWGEAWNNLAAASLRANDLDEASAAAERALTLEPHSAAGWFHQADVLGRRRRWAESRQALERAIALQPRFPEAYNNLGLALKALALEAAAIEAFQTALAQDPSFAEPCNNLGQMFLDAGDHEQALSWLNRSLQIKSDEPQSLFCMGNYLNAVGRYDEAATWLRRAVELRPDFPEALNNLGNVLLTLRRHDEGLEAFERAIRSRPDYHEAHANLGNLQREARFPDLAEASMLEAIRLKPDFAAAHSNLGNAYFDQGKIDLALASYKRGIDLGQDDRDFVPNYLFALNYSPSLSDAEIAAEHRRLCNEKFGHLVEGLPFPAPRDPNKRLRIGYVSPDFWMHPVARFMLPLLQHHDRRHFEVVAYSSRYLKDAFTEECARHVDLWWDCHHLSDAALARRIRDDRIDILVDLTMHSRDCRPGLFARKPAPLQVSYLAYVGTTGQTTMDYRLTDIYLDPPGGPESPFPEKPLRLSRCWWTFQPPVRTTIPAVVPPPCLDSGVITFGSLNNFVKVNEGTRALWAKLVASVPEARLLLHIKESRAREGLLEFLAGHGVPAERVTLIGYQDGPSYMATYGRIDVALDPSPFAGGTTTFDALWMGVPVITLAGDRMASRGGRSILATLGRSEWIAKSADEYIAIAQTLASDPHHLAAIRRELRDEIRNSPLMDNAGFARDVEAQYRAIWQAWSSSPRHPSDGG
jgi:predicted O-linked N-acetylglucosamine transferase (SPINDLY family)